jgi:hypothetical protein
MYYSFKSALIFIKNLQENWEIYLFRECFPTPEILLKITIKQFYELHFAYVSL